MELRIVIPNNVTNPTSVPSESEPYVQNRIPTWYGPIKDAKGRWISSHIINQDVIAWKLPAALWGYFHQRKPWDDWITTHRIGLAAARRLEDRYGQAWILTSVGIAHREQHNYTEALDCLTRAASASPRWCSKPWMPVPPRT